LIYVNSKLESCKIESPGRLPDVLERGNVEWRALTPDRFAVIIEMLRYSGCSEEQAVNVTKIEEMLKADDRRAEYYVKAGMNPV